MGPHEAKRLLGSKGHRKRDNYPMRENLRKIHI